jgi:glycosyltransferase involved in cell wall biosynthesis
MIVRNEEDYIAQCIESAVPVVDEVIIVDTGSADKTIEIARSYSNKVKIYNYQWTEDFSAARNVSLQYSNADWILVMDADEKIVFEKERLFELLEDSSKDAYIIPIHNLLSEKSELTSFSMVRLFKRTGASYEGAIHEQLVISGTSGDYVIIDENICKIIHYGYLPEVIKKKDKLKRNITILDSEIGKNPDNPFNWYNLGSTYLKSNSPEAAIIAFQKSLELCGDRKFTYTSQLIFKMAQCCWIQYKPDECIKLVKEYLAYDDFKEISGLYYYLGLSYKDKKMYDEAIANFNRCMAAKENDYDFQIKGMASFLPMLEIARLLVLKDNWEEAVRVYKQAVFHPENSARDGENELNEVLKKYGVEKLQ